jgi:pimeloyl-ACP methyl ester carboxylesterase
VQQPETHYARTPDGAIAYQIVGEGPLDLVFIGPWVSNVDVMWEEPRLARLLEHLARFSRLICFDRRGTGASDSVALDTLPSLEQWSDDARAVMLAAGSQRAAVLGVGQGGDLAMLFAASHPELTSALVLVNSTARYLDDVDYAVGFPEGLSSSMMDKIHESWGSGRAVHFLAPSTVGDERFQRWYGRYERLAMGPRAARVIHGLQLENDLRAVLPAIRVPTLVLHRVGDRTIPVLNGRYLAKHIPGAKYVELPGADHLVFIGETATLLGEIEEFLTGTREVPEIDRVLATVLFTDIVGSTERAVALGDRAWRALLDSHNEIARRELSRHRGQEVEFTGDGLLARFDGPGRAIRCALAITETVRGLGIEVRAGLHTGEIELAGDAVRGIAVHIGARVASEAAAGEVLVSSTVRDLVAGSGIRFADRGSHVLKGVPGEWRLFSASSPRDSFAQPM